MTADDKRQRIESINRYEVSLRQANKHSVHDEMIRLLCEWARESIPHDVERHAWIAVKDRVPEWNVPVLTYQPRPHPESYRMNVAALKKGYGGKPYWSMAAIDTGVTHWMPLPDDPVNSGSVDK